MKKIRIIFSTAFVVTLLFTIIVFVSCDKGKTKYNDSALLRPCDNVICLNGGTCSNGVCNCPQGFEGVKCETKWSSRFVGDYIADDDCDTSAAGYYSAQIYANPDYAYKLRLYNVGLFCPNVIISAEINPEKTSFSIPIQKSCGNLYLSGYGNINGKFVNVYLTSRDTILHSSKQCSILLNKQ